MLFGNSRGRFPIERHSGFEDQLYRLFEKVHGKDFYSSGEDFENEVFKIMPYYWGDCTCGYDNMDDFPGRHSSNCYQHDYRLIIDRHRAQGKSTFDNPELDKEVKALCKKFGHTYPQGCAVHCDCDYHERVEEWHKDHGYPHGHTDECMFTQPNFWYKPTDFRIDWYKYPMRDSYMNQEMDISGFTQIIEECIASVTEVK